jgi:AraC-like DNA-binding protein
MKYIFLIGAFNAFFFLILLLQKRPLYLYDRILLFWLMYLGSYVTAYSFMSGYLFQHHHILSVSFISLLLLHGPFLYLYISAFALKKSSLTFPDYLHFLPFLLFNIYLFVVSSSPTAADVIRMDHTPSEIKSPFLFIFFLVLTALSGPVYFIISALLFRKLDRNIMNNFSFSDNIDLGWLRRLIFIFGIVWTIFMGIASVYHVFQLFSIRFCTDGLFLAISVFIILIGYFGLKQKAIFINYPAIKQEYVIDQPKKYTGFSLKEEEASELKDKLIGHMEIAKPYLDPDLTLPRLAESLDIPSYMLSRVLNESMNRNFFDFVNGYRIEDVKSKIIDPRFSNYSILGIAFESGFNSKSAFNRIFKKSTGKTPTQYRQTVQDNIQG